MRRFLFDAYGTLFDLSGALQPAEERLGDKAASVLDQWRTLQLDYAWLAALQERYRNFELLTREAFQDALAANGIEDTELVDMLADGFRSVAAYPDARETLTGLKAKDAVTAILSNGTPDMLHAAVAHAELSGGLDGVLSVDTAATYKPSPKAYAVGTNFMDALASDIIFVSSNWWDVAGAAAFGYSTVWINRGGGVWPPSKPKPERVVSSLADLVSLAD